jgi:diguanylate cyclase (GGDEF)-like protein/PAS domain S-box-containing protein
VENSEWLNGQSCLTLTDYLQDGVFVIENEKFVYANQRLAEMFGYPVGKLIGRPFIELVAEQDKAMVLERHRNRMAGKYAPEYYDLHINTAQGTIICCSMNIGLSTDPTTGQIVAVGSARDVTAQQAAQAELQASKDELKAIFDHLPDVFYRTDMNGIVTKASPSCLKFLGYTPEEMIGTPLADYYYTPEERKKVVQAIIDGNGEATQVEAALKRKDGTVIWVSTSAYTHSVPDGTPICIEGIARDISDRKQLEDELIALSRTDGLTGAYNRGHFMEKSKDVITLMRRYQLSASIIMMDLDYFKTINDQYGHHGGDIALQAFAGICQQEIRESDIFGRLGGEEFALMLPETPIEQARKLAERIRIATEVLRIPIDDEEMSMTVSIGFAKVGTDENALSTALRKADRALYKAKEEGRNKVCEARAVA